MEKITTTIEIEWLELKDNPTYSSRKSRVLQTSHHAEVELKQAVGILRSEGFVVHIKNYDYDEEDEFQLSDVKGRLCDLEPELVKKMSEEEKEKLNYFFLIIDAYNSEGSCKKLNSLLKQWNCKIPTVTHS